MLRIQMKQNINLIEKRGLDNLKDPKAFIEYSNNMHGVSKNIEGYYQAEKLMC